MTDPHDRPYTFGWHGEVTRRLSVTDDTPDEAWQAYADDHATMPVVPVTRLPEPSEDVDTLGDLLADLRNEYPRHSGDMDSWHLAEEILASGWLAERDRATAARAKAEALEEAAGKVMGHGDGGPVRLVTVRRWLLDRATAYREGDL